MLQHMLTQADLAKFARSIPPENFHHDASQFAKKLVLATQYIAPVPNEQSSIILKPDN